MLFPQPDLLSAGESCSPSHTIGAIPEVLFTYFHIIGIIEILLKKGR